VLTLKVDELDRPKFIKMEPDVDHRYAIELQQILNPAETNGVGEQSNTVAEAAAGATAADMSMIDAPADCGMAAAPADNGRADDVEMDQGGTASLKRKRNGRCVTFRQGTRRSQRLMKVSGMV
jgi:hypothetical protein